MRSKGIFSRWRLPLFSIIGMLSLQAAPAYAVLVTPTTMASVEFDISGYGALNIHQASHACTADFAGPCDALDDQLAQGASFLFSLGTTLGGDDLYSLRPRGPSGAAGGNLTSVFCCFPDRRGLFVEALVDSVFATFVYVDDEFEVGIGRLNFQLVGDTGNFTTLQSTAIELAVEEETSEPPTAVPAPGSIPLLLTALAGFAALTRRRAA